MNFLKRFFNKNNSDEKIPTIDDIKGKTYATFTDNGIRVDLERYFQTPQGQEAIRKSCVKIDINNK